MRSLATELCTAPQLQANSPPLKKCHLYTRGQVDFKIMLLMLHEKHKKKCFIRSMRSTKLTFTTPLQRKYRFCFVIFTAEGCQKWQIVLLMLHEKHTKSMRFTEHEKQKTYFCNPSRLIASFFREHARLFPALAGPGRFRICFEPKRSDRNPPNTRRGPG